MTAFVQVSNGKRGDEFVRFDFNIDRMPGCCGASNVYNVSFDYSNRRKDEAEELFAKFMMRDTKGMSWDIDDDFDDFFERGMFILTDAVDGEDGPEFASIYSALTNYADPDFTDISQEIYNYNSGNMIVTFSINRSGLNGDTEPEPRDDMEW